MKGIWQCSSFIFSFITIISIQALANESPKIYVRSYANHIVAGGYHSMVIDENGRVWAWGNNGSGRLGNSAAGSKAATPVPVDTINADDQLSRIISIAGGFSHSLALQENGQVLAWGSNNLGQVGNIDIATADSPVYVNGPADKTDLSEIIAIASGMYHSVALRSDGTVWTWGGNNKGQLGNNSTQTQYRPVQVIHKNGSSYLSDIIAIAAGGYHTLALESNGQIWAWGDHKRGQLGINDETDHFTTPVLISNLYEITHICAGKSHSLARKSNGTVFAWGENSDNQLGYKTTLDYSRIPREVNSSEATNLLNVVDIAAGDKHSLALINDGTIQAWGNNEKGQLGIGANHPIYPTTVINNINEPIPSVMAISAGSFHSMALLRDGRMMTWGLNDDGQLGDSTKTVQFNPVFVRDAEGFFKPGNKPFGIRILEDETLQPIILTLRDKGYQELRLSAVSSNESIISELFFDGQSQPITVPISTMEGKDVPFTFNLQPDAYGTVMITITVSNPLSVTQIVHLKVIVAPINDPPEILPIDTIEINEDAPTQTVPLTIQDVDNNTFEISAQSQNTDIISQSSLKVSAENRHLQFNPLPDQFGTAVISITVADPEGLSSQTDLHVNVKPENDPPVLKIWPDIIQVASGYTHNLVIKNDWTVWAWGSNSKGQLGVGEGVPQNLPAQLKDHEGLTDVIAVAAGHNHSLALTVEGNALAWGSNEFGQLGNSSDAELSSTPVYVLDEFDEPFKKGVAIAAGTYHSLLLTGTNELWGWGKNVNGQLGVTTQTNFNKPVKVQTDDFPEDIRIIQIAAGETHSLALLENGQVWAWGDNSRGQLGQPNVSASLTPIVVDRLSNIIAIDAGAFHSLAIDRDGHIWTFGSNEYGQLGNNGPDSTTPKKVQVQNVDLSNISQIAAGADHSLAIQNNGTIWAWGKNTYGQLGTGATENEYFPKKIQSAYIPLSHVLAIDAGQDHSILFAQDIWAWGRNTSFQLGTGNNNQSTIPVQTRSEGSESFTPGSFPLEFYTADGVPTQPIQVSLYDQETLSNELTLTASSQNTTILPQENIDITDTGVNRQIVMTPSDNETGNVIVDLIVSDGQKEFKQQLTLGVNKFSDPPEISDIDDQLGKEDHALTPITFTVSDPDTSLEQLKILVTSSNIDLVPNHENSLTFTGNGAEKTLYITPQPNQFGETEIIIRVSDGINTQKSKFIVNFQPVNDPPEISDIADQEIKADEEIIHVDFTITDIAAEAQYLSAWALSNRPEIVPNDNAHLFIIGDDHRKVLAIKPIRDAAGDLTITVFASDGMDETSKSFHLHVHDYKRSPQISSIENLTIMEDSTNTVINYTVTDADSGAENVIITALSSDPLIIPNDNEHIQLLGTGTNRSLLIIPQANQSGLATVTIKATDPDNLFDQKDFLVTVENINDPPVIINITSTENLEIKENKSFNPFIFKIDDVDSSSDDLNITMTSSNTDLVPIKGLILSDLGVDQTLEIIPNKNKTGQTIITIEVSDGHLTDQLEFTLTVLPENFPPEMSEITNQSTPVNTDLILDFTINDQESDPSSLPLTAYSSNENVVPNNTSHLTITQNGSDCILRIIPLAGVAGELTITLQLQDDKQTVSQSFLLVINNPPIISEIPDMEIAEDETITNFELTVDAIESNQIIQIAAKSDHPELMPDNQISFTGSAMTRYLSMTPIENQNGTAMIDVCVTDCNADINSYCYASACTSFKLTVISVNDPPTISAINPVVTDEDAAQSIPVTIADVDEEKLENLKITATSDNIDLIPSENIHFSFTSGYLYLTPITNAFGNANITLTVTDSEDAEVAQTFSFEVKPVNDPPETLGETHNARINIPYTGQLQAWDVDNASLIFTISAQPYKGSVTLVNLQDNNDTFTYQPNPGQWGLDSFKFTVSDGQIVSPPETVIIDIHDDIPPQITLNGLNPTYIIKGNKYIEQGYIACDNNNHTDCNNDNDLTNMVKVTGNVNTNKIGAYFIQYQVEDKSDNVAQVTREVVVLENMGQLQGTVIDTIGLTENDIHVQLLSPITKEVVRDNINIDSTGNFIVSNLSYQSYIVRSIISNPDYLTEVVDQDLLFQFNNQSIEIHIPQLTEIDDTFELKVALGGDYQPYTFYQYTIQDSNTSEVIRESISDSPSFTEQLKFGTYRLIILAKSCAPYEYFPIQLTQDTFLHKDDIQLKELLSYDPFSPSVDVSHILLNKDQGDIDDGFQMWFERHAFNSDDNFQVKIKTQNDEIQLDQWAEIISNQPYAYVWTVTTADEKYLYTEKGMSYYLIRFLFYQGETLLRTYDVRFMRENETPLPDEPQQVKFEAYTNETVRYESQSKHQFYPLAGIDTSVKFKENAGKVVHKAVSIPSIPLNLLKTADNRTIQSSDQLTTTIRYYTFNGDTVSTGVSLDFTTEDGKKVYYNPSANRNQEAPEITLPLYLNRESAYFSKIQQASLSQAQNMLHVMVYDESNPSQGFHKEDIPFTIQDDGLVLVRINHLSMVTLEINDNWNMFNNDSLDDGRCFIQSLGPGFASYCYIFVLLFIVCLRKFKGDK